MAKRDDIATPPKPKLKRDGSQLDSVVDDCKSRKANDGKAVRKSRKPNRPKSSSAPKRNLSSSLEHGSDKDDDVPLLVRGGSTIPGTPVANAGKGNGSLEACISAGCKPREVETQAKVLKLQEELNDCRKQLAQRTSDAETASAEKRDADVNISELELEIGMVREEGEKRVRAKEKEMKAKMQELEGKAVMESVELKLQLGRLKKDVESLMAEKSDLEGQLQSAKKKGEEVNSLKVEVQSLQKKLEDAWETYSQREEEYDKSLPELKAQCDKNKEKAIADALRPTEAKVTALNIQLATLQASHCNLQKEAEKVPKLEVEILSYMKKLEEEEANSTALQEELNDFTSDHAKELSLAQLKYDDLSARYADLKAEHEALKKTRLPISPSPPAPSASAASPLPPAAHAPPSDPQKDENIRKTLLRNKKKLDTIRAVANSIVVSTRGMQLSSFGDFGAYIKQMRSVIEGAEEDGGNTGPGGG